MNAIKSFWKVWLRPNLLTKDVENDYYAEVSTTNNTVRNEDLARYIVASGSPFKIEDVLSIINQRDLAEREMLVRGSSVQTGNCHMTPRVSGPWLGSNATYDSKVHTKTLDMVPTAEVRTVLDGVGIEVLGVKDSGAHIGSVTDSSTKLKNDTMTADEDLIIDGDKIKIAPEDEAGLGVFFVDEAGVEIPVTHKFSTNERKKVVVRVPATLVKGKKYTLRIVTRYSNSSTLLLAPRTIIYERLLLVV